MLHEAEARQTENECRLAIRDFLNGLNLNCIHDVEPRADDLCHEITKIIVPSDGTVVSRVTR